VQFEVIP